MNIHGLVPNLVHKCPEVVPSLSSFIYDATLTQKPEVGVANAQKHSKKPKSAINFTYLP